MPTYAFRCEGCGRTHMTVLPMARSMSPGPCTLCGGHLIRDFRGANIGFRPGWGTHFNASTGTVVRNNQEFDSDLKRRAEAMSEKLGYEHEYTRVEDPAQAGIDVDRAAEVRARTAEYVAKHPGAA